MRLPASCPQCGERQNQLAPGFDPEREPFGGATCKICGHAFSAQEYRRGLAQAAGEFEGRRAQDVPPSARPRTN